MQVAIYARYSSENQREASIEDQFRICREYAERQGWHIKTEFHDAAISGYSTLTRPGVQALMRAVKQKQFDIVLTESLSRLSRDLEDVAGLYKRIKFSGANLYTLADGEVSSMHIGFKGTMAAMDLEKIRAETLRGQRGNIEKGQSSGGVSYGYRIVYGALDGNGKVKNGVRAINESEAIIVRRIFTMYLAGASSKVIAKTLNAEGVASPRSGKRAGARWSPSTIHGNPDVGLGILHNELYNGRMVWNRQSWVKDPDTGNRVSRLNPQSDWQITNVPELRIVTPAQWDAVQARRARRHQVRIEAQGKASVLGGANRYLFSGLTKCGKCGAGFVMHNGRLCCFGRVQCGSCDNDRTIGRDEVEQRVKAALVNKLMNKESFTVFCEEFVAEVNRLRMAKAASQHGTQAELARVKAEAARLLKLAMDGLDCKDAYNALRAQERALEVTLAHAEKPEPLLHPKMADIYKRKVTQLVAALDRDDTRAEAQDVVRDLIDAIVISAHGSGKPEIELQGNIAKLLTLATDGAKTLEIAPITEVIAGERIDLSSTFWKVAA